MPIYATSVLLGAYCNVIYRRFSAKKFQNVFMRMVIRLHNSMKTFFFCQGMTHPALHFDESAADSRRQFRFRPRHFDSYRFTVCCQASNTIKSSKYITKSGLLSQKINIKI